MGRHVRPLTERQRAILLRMDLDLTKDPPSAGSFLSILHELVREALRTGGLPKQKRRAL